MKRKALIISIKGTNLSTMEKKLLSKEKPWGVILFKRNLKSFKQIKRLTSTIRSLTKDRKFPIIIDEEGLKVSRLSNVINHKISARFFGRLFEKIKILYKYLSDIYNFLCKIFREIGININTIPVLDVLRKNTHEVIVTEVFQVIKK